MDGAFTGLSAGAADGLAVNRHHALRHADQRGGPGHETALELLRVEGGEDVAEMIVRRRAVEEWTEAPEQVEFHATESGDIDEGFGSGQHREQRQQEYLLERIHDLAALSRIRHILEMIEKCDRIAKRPAVFCYIIHDHPPKCESRGSS